MWLHIGNLLLYRQPYLFVYFGYQKLSFPSSLLDPSTLLCVLRTLIMSGYPLPPCPTPTNKKQTPETWAILIGSLPTFYMCVIYILWTLSKPQINLFMCVVRFWWSNPNGKSFGLSSTRSLASDKLPPLFGPWDALRNQLSSQNWKPTERSAPYSSTVELYPHPFLRLSPLCLLVIGGGGGGSPRSRCNKSTKSK